MITDLSVDQFLEQAQKIPVVDVRSPGEFAQGHIDGAVNIPLFSDEERAAVGTAYKQQSREQAVLLGLEFAGPKLKQYVIEAKKSAVDGNLLIYCWRGGMRSEFMARIFEMADIQVGRLIKGYKAYRSYVRESFSHPANILILSGQTGSGKTDILHELSALGEQVLDLENLAHHKGSAFGAIGERPQNSNEQFENNLFARWSQLDPERPIWVEDESASIGRNQIPPDLFAQMRAATVVNIKVDKSLRIRRLVKEYTDVDKEEFVACLEKIRKRLEPVVAKEAIEAAKQGQFEMAIDLALKYYDKAYQFGLNKRSPSTIRVLGPLEDDPAENARKLIEYRENEL